MDRKKYRTYTQEFKQEALELLESSEKSASELERELGITTGMLLKWKQRYKVNKAEGLGSNDTSKTGIEGYNDEWGEAHHFKSHQA